MKSFQIVSVFFFLIIIQLSFSQEIDLECASPLLQNITTEWEFITDPDQHQAFIAESGYEFLTASETDIDEEFQITHFTHGERVYGDICIGRGVERIFYYNTVDITYFITFPEGDNRGIITAFVLQLETSIGAYGEVFIKSGGRGKNYVVVGINAFNTNLLGFRFLVYGFP